MTPEAADLAALARLPREGDNVAIAIRTLAEGTTIWIGGKSCRLRETVLEGHRFAVAPIRAGADLLSWRLPFGRALRDIAVGEYVINTAMLEALRLRQLGHHLPTQPNFADLEVRFHLDEATFRPAPPMDRVAVPRTFLGYDRGPGRGVGTRNYVVVLGTSSRTASMARQLADRLAPLVRLFPGVDGIVPVAHTEGGGNGEPNNAAEIMRALAGFMVHGNVGAVLALDQGSEPVGNARLEAYMRARGYPLAAVQHRFLSIGRTPSLARDEAESVLRSWLPAVSAALRTDQPLAGLRIALQCGGSDAFSGLSGNPLAGAMVHEVVRHGGTGVLTETDELIGSEPYLVQSFADLATARALFERIESFKERLAWHGTTAESNPSGGNRLRGLYNITLKSLGAVHKKDPRTRIDRVVDYAEQLGDPGFYFMDGPGNDLEGVAGQVAGGCNLIVFVTGNGSITNFPFVPTLKVTTTTRRHRLLENEMDFNAGRYLDGEDMAALAAEAFDQVVAAASGRRTQGERAGHSQVSLWREWRQTSRARLPELRARPVPDGRPLRPAAGPAGPVRPLERVGLLLPTSMCAAQIARLAANRLTARAAGGNAGIARFVALAHTEGCGFGGETMYAMLERAYAGYLRHPNVAAALLLEHGCEKLTNDVMRQRLAASGEPGDRYGWASVQLDGGIERVLERIEHWFTNRPVVSSTVPAESSARSLRLNIGLISEGQVGAVASDVCTELVREVLAHGGSVLVPEGDDLLTRGGLGAARNASAMIQATLASGQSVGPPGLHVVATESGHWVENCTSLGACGAQVIVGFVTTQTQQGHPLVPVMQVVPAEAAGAFGADDVDVALDGMLASDYQRLRACIIGVADGTCVPVAMQRGWVDFQLARGELGVTV